MRAWWSALSARDRRMLVIGAIIAALLLGWSLLWQPFARSRAQLLARVQVQREDLAWMQQTLLSAQSLHTLGARGQADRQGKSLLALADATARGAGLGAALKHVEPATPKSVRVSFDTVNFDALVVWIDSLVRDYGVQASDLSADRAEGIGLVNARVTLEEP